MTKINDKDIIITKELVQYSGKTFSSSKQAYEYILEAFERVYESGKRDGRSVASFSSELERIKKEVRQQTIDGIEEKVFHDLRICSGCCKRIRQSLNDIKGEKKDV